MTKDEPDYKEITQERYYDLYWLLPRLYIATVDGRPVDNGFAACEAHDYNPRGVELTVCFRAGPRFFEAIANFTNQYGMVTDYAGRAGTDGYHADTHYRKTLGCRYTET